MKHHLLEGNVEKLVIKTAVQAMGLRKAYEWLGHSDFPTTANIYAHLDYRSNCSSAGAMLAGLGTSAT